MRALALTLLASVAFAKETPLVADPIENEAGIADALREHYTKHEYRIPMRDGVALYTTAYVPKADGRYPMLLIRTPYSLRPYGVDAVPHATDERELRTIAPGPEFVRQGYVFVQQDVRGRNESEGGAFVDIRPLSRTHGPKDTDESTDAWDTIDFLVHHVPRNNGNVGMWGISYPGFYATMSLVGSHPALKAVSPQAPVTDWFGGDDFHHNGAFFVADAFMFQRWFVQKHDLPTRVPPTFRPLDAGDLYDYFLRLGTLADADTRLLDERVQVWQDLVAHPTLDDFWRARDVLPALRNVKPAVLTVGGLFDAEDLFGTLATYRTIEQHNAGIENALVLGPWRHGGWQRSDGAELGDIAFGAKTSRWFRAEVELPFFERHLRGRALPKTPEATVFQTGTNEWHHYDVWPPRDAKPTTLYLGNGAITTKLPPVGRDAYPSDPAHPVPYTDKHAVEQVEYMNGDQRFATRRPDVVTYRSAPLSEDVALAGPITATLWVSTTGTDADFVVKLVDVYPATVPDPIPNPTRVRLAGYEQLVRGEVMRGKFRDSLSDPKPFVSGQPTKVRFTLPDVSHVFRTGHRIEVHVQSSWFPLVDRNPQRFCDIYKATEADFRAETHTIWTGGEHASSIEVRIDGPAVRLP